MKGTLLFLLLISQVALAHREDPRERREAPYAGVKSVKKITYFTLPREGNKLDTCIVESEQYNRDGLLTQHDYAMVMQKNPKYEYQEKFSYAAEDAWTRQVYKNKVLTDSVLVNGSFAKHYSFLSGKPHSLHEYDGDSLQEKMINGGDTLFRSKKLNKYFNRDNFWDYQNAGTFDKRTEMSDKDGSTTVTYFNARNEALVSYTEKRVAGGQIYEVDYCNYKVKKFVFKRLTYSEQMEMAFFLRKSRKDHWSYQVLYTYNDKGQLIEERWIDPNPKKNQVVIKYEYEFY